MAGNLIAILVGVLFMAGGAILTYVWREDFFAVFKGCIGVTLVFVGFLAAVIGISEYKATKEFEAATSGSESTGQAETKPTSGESPSA